ncbi:GerAB/ArcD/ProY family transporter [Cohnella caldifontis]|uniref:GerAB/ArcD/ProY family transporter n=1 Tax=Cohnella caldifontis TaxID=3027471 RepID=UPI0023EDD1B8|nr:GerAB/ArcD/ProY family transporter [Cohnella sp. YIM B05605]
MSRYFYYLFWLSLLINTIFFVPRLLMNERFNGSIMSVALGIVYGSVCAIIFVLSMNQFPGEGLPEILKRYVPDWIRVPSLLFLGGMFAIAGSLILIAFSMVTLRFLSPETNPAVMLLCYCGLGCFAACFRPSAILNINEIVLLVNFPFIFYIMYKSVTSRDIDWDSIQVLSDYALKPPNLIAFAAATYPFTGYLKLVLYNRIFKKLKIKHLWLIPLTGLLVMLSSFLSPVGLLGVDSVGEYLYTWISTADTLRMQFGFIQRVVFLFLFIYIGFSLLYITTCWNIYVNFVTDAIGKTTITVKSRKIPVQVLASLAISVITLVSGFRTSDKGMLDFVIGWQYIRLATEALLVISVVWFALLRRRQKRHA